jgi:histidine triad (HIT) family protein
VAGQVAASFVVRQPDVVAFLDHRPVFHGHVLVVPTQHVVTLADLPSSQLPGLFGVAQQLSVAVEQGLQADGSFVALNNKVSQSVPHLHVHVVPRRRKDGLRGFFWPRVKYDSDAAMDAVAERLRQALAQLPGG